MCSFLFKLYQLEFFWLEILGDHSVFLIMFLKEQEGEKLAY